MSEKLEVPAKDRAVLEGWLRAPSTPQRLAMRATVILASSDGESLRSISRRLKVSVVSICRWRDRYRGEGLGGLQTRQRAGRTPTITLADEGYLLAVARRDERALARETRAFCKGGLDGERNREAARGAGAA